MSAMMQPQIILLKEGTDTSQGKAQVISNINACTAVADVVRITLGPRGMDKLIYDDKGNTTISNDGATIMKLLDIIHPAAKILVDIARSQDSEVDDGTTTVVLLAGEFLKEAKPFIEDGVHPQNLIRSYRTASQLAIEKVKNLAVSIEGKSLDEKKKLLGKCAETTLSSKLIGGEKEFFAEMVVNAVIAVGDDDRLKMIGIKKVPGGTMRDSFLVNGVAFKKTFSYAGFQQQPKKFLSPKILLLNIELELKSEKENAEIRLSDPSQYQSIVDAEWNIIYDKLDKCVQTGAKIVLSRLAIGDLATQYFADRDIFCAGRVAEEDLQRVAAATGGTVQTSVNNIIEEVLGTCEEFEEKQVGNERFNIFNGCPSGRTATIVLRGGADQFIEQAERSLHDAIMIVRRALKNSTVVPGGGAIDMEISRYLRQHARTIAGKSQLFINSYAKALEVIPRHLCDNAGFDATDVLNKLRQKHALPSGEGANFGVDINTGAIADSFTNFVWEPAVVKINAINAATEAACLILSVDETVKNPMDNNNSVCSTDLPEMLGGEVIAPLSAMSLPQFPSDSSEEEEAWVWNQIKSEARRDAELELALASYLCSTILSHSSLERSLSFHLGNKLCSSTLLSTLLYDLFLNTFSSDATLRACVVADLRAARVRDPACVSFSHCLLNYKGFLACQAHRIAHKLWNQQRRPLALALHARISEVFAVDIHPAARIGKGILFDHATGVVIGETAVIGNNCSILHHVTLGGTGNTVGDRHPKVGDGVLIGAGATILGNITIGEGAKIGAGSVVLIEVPPRTTAVGNPARLVGGKEKPSKNSDVPAESMDHTSFISEWSDYII